MAEGNGSVLKKEDLFGPDVFEELHHSQKEEAEFLKRAHSALRDDPDIARQVRKIAEYAQNQHSRTKDFKGTATLVVEKMIPLIEKGVRKQKADFVGNGLKKVLSYVDDIIQETNATKNEYKKIIGQICEEISTKIKRNKEKENEIAIRMKDNELRHKKGKQDVQELESKHQSIEEELKQLKVERHMYLEQSVPKHGEKLREYLSGAIYTTGIALLITFSQGHKAGHDFFKTATGANTARIEQASQQAIVASEKKKEDIQYAQYRVDENEKRISKMRDDDIEREVGKEKLAFEKATQMNEECWTKASEELGKVAALLVKILWFWEDFSAKLTTLSKSHDVIEQLIEIIHDPDFAEEMIESVGQVKEEWNSFGEICTVYVDESEKQLYELYAFMSQPFDQMAVTEGNRRQKELIEAPRKEIKELESKTM